MQSHRFRNSIYAIISMLILVVLFYNLWDINVEHWFLQQPHTFWYRISGVLATVFASGVWFSVALFTLFVGLCLHYLAKKPSTARPWLFFACAYLLAFILRTVLKFILARYRPELYFTQGLYGFHWFSLRHAFNSMPSGHAVSAFAGFYAFAKIFQKAWLTTLCLILAVIVAISRLVVLAHYPSDIIFGAYVGMLSVYWVYPLFYKS